MIHIRINNVNYHIKFWNETVKTIICIWKLKTQTIKIGQHHLKIYHEGIFRYLYVHDIIDKLLIKDQQNVFW